MSNYVQTTFFTPKDSLPPSNPAKTIFGAAYDVEFGNIAAAVSSKFDTSTIASGPIAFNLGTPALPGITFIGETGTGLSSNVSGDLVLSTAGTANLTVSGTTEGVTISTPASGVALLVNGLANQFTTSIQGSSASGQSQGLLINAGTTAADRALLIENHANTSVLCSLFGDGSFSIGNHVGANIPALSGANTGALTVASPASGVALTVNSATANTGILINPADSISVAIRVIDPGANNTDLRIETTNSQCVIQCNGTSTSLTLQSSGGTGITLAADKGTFLGAATGSSQGAGSLNAQSLFINGRQIFSGIPQNPQAGNYTLALTDQNQHILASGAAAVITIPANASIAFPVGAGISVLNNSAGNQSLNITTDTLRWGTPVVTGNRVLAAGAIVTLLKISTQIWALSGTGIS